MTDTSPSTECPRCGRVPAESEDHDFPALGATERRRFCITAACDDIPAVDWFARTRELESEVERWRAEMDKSVALHVAAVEREDALRARLAETEAALVGLREAADDMRKQRDENTATVLREREAHALAVSFLEGLGMQQRAALATVTAERDAWRAAADALTGFDSEPRHLAAAIGKLRSERDEAWAKLAAVEEEASHARPSMVRIQRALRGGG